ncbi:nucleotidyltransferase [Candidatus Altiarchaeales archaeon WOR_SM1_SCG]|nr:nucleotidyltransferase [Candidatus Altiarchaeales archaeon WOR_SM1_SCG]
MMKFNEIKQMLAEHKQELKDKFRVKEIGVFGSYIRGKETEKSDVDMLVEFYGPPGWEFIDLEDYLSNLIGVKVDLVMKTALKPRIGKHILREVQYI